MVKVVKVDPEWFPIEKPDLKVGETIDITNPQTLLDQGKVKLAKEEEEYKCDVCGFVAKSKIGLIGHAKKHNV